MPLGARGWVSWWKPVEKTLVRRESECLQWIFLSCKLVIIKSTNTKSTKYWIRKFGGRLAEDFHRIVVAKHSINLATSSLLSCLSIFYFSLCDFYGFLKILLKNELWKGMNGDEFVG